MAEVGQKAPNFELPSTKGDKIKLSDFIGKKNVLLAFYCLNWTSGCTNQVSQLRDNLKKFHDANTEVLAASVDHTFAQKEWAKDLNLNFPLLADFNKDTAKAYGVLHGETGFFKDKLGLVGVAKRSVFLIDKNGIIRYKWLTDDPTKLPDVNTLAQEVAKLK